MHGLRLHGPRLSRDARQAAGDSSAGLLHGGTVSAQQLPRRLVQVGAEDGGDAEEGVVPIRLLGVAVGVSVPEAAAAHAAGGESRAGGEAHVESGDVGREGERAGWQRGEAKVVPKEGGQQQHEKTQQQQQQQQQDARNATTAGAYRTPSPRCSPTTTCTTNL